MLRQAAKQFARRGKDRLAGLENGEFTADAFGLREFCTGNVCAAKKRSKTEFARVKEQAANVLDKPALGDGFSQVPQEPRFLGLAGALPFLTLAPPIAAGIPLMPADFVSSAATLQIGYGASIASFLGGIHWALAMANYTIGSAYVVDRSFAKRGLLPSWYMALRLPLTLAAVGGLGITCANSFRSHVPGRGPILEQEPS